MKVSQLVDILNDCDPDANVILAEQPNWPLEHALEGIAVREEFSLDDRADGRRPNDVILLEGRQLRYGSRDAWSNPTRG